MAFPVSNPRARSSAKKEQIQDAEKGIKNVINLSGRIQSRICKWEIKDTGRCEMTNTMSCRKSQSI